MKNRQKLIEVAHQYAGMHGGPVESDTARLLVQLADAINEDAKIIALMNVARTSLKELLNILDGEGSGRYEHGTDTDN